MFLITLQLQHKSTFQSGGWFMLLHPTLSDSYCTQSVASFEHVRWCKKQLIQFGLALLDCCQQRLWFLVFLENISIPNYNYGVNWVFHMVTGNSGARSIHFHTSFLIFCAITFAYCFFSTTKEETFSSFQLSFHMTSCCGILVNCHETIKCMLLRYVWKWRMKMWIFSPFICPSCSW